jgi:Tfp pilus assembly protein PilF
MIDPSHLFNQALEAMEANDTERATRFLRSVLLHDPTDTEAALLLVGIFKEDGLLTEAASLLTGHLEQAREPIDALIELAELRLMLRDPGGAAEVLRAVLESRPNHWLALSLMGDAFVDVGALPEGARAYEQALESNPFGSSIWFNLACVRLKLEDSAGAKAAFEAYLRCVPDAPDRQEVEAKLAALEKDETVEP